jgi:hypothetical protein
MRGEAVLHPGLRDRAFSEVGAENSRRRRPEFTPKTPKASVDSKLSMTLNGPPSTAWLKVQMACV